MIYFWVSTGSTYSYLMVMRLRSVEEASVISFRRRPFSVRAIMIEQKNIPFVDKTVKLAYMWRESVINPALQCVEWLRSAYYGGYGSNILDKAYVIRWGVGSMLVGLALERLVRAKVLAG